MHKHCDLLDSKFNKDVIKVLTCGLIENLNYKKLNTERIKLYECFA